jgi:hypothetical protein
MAKPTQAQNQKKPTTSLDVPVPRGSRGKWVKGQSGNPTKKGRIGRPRGSYRVDLKDMCREVAEEAVAALRAALKDKSTVVGAANTLLAHGFGKPMAVTTVRVIRTVEDLSEEELRMLAGGTEEDGTRLLIEGDVDDDEEQAAG